MISLFSINKKGIIVIDKPEVALYPEFEELIKRDYEAKNVADITRVYIAFRELHYVYEIADHSSYTNRRGMSNNEAHIYAKEIAQLDSNWEIDDIVSKAIERYRSLQDSVSLRAVISLRKSLDTSIKIAGDFTEYNKMLYEKMKSLPDDDNKKSLLVEFIDRQKSIDNIVSNVTKNISELKNAEELLKKEEVSSKLGRKGVKITNSMKYDTTN